VEWLARFGYGAKGVVYLVVGILAVQVAIGDGGQTEGTTGALQTIAAQPFGQVLLGLVAFGLFGYAIWCFVRAFMDAEREGSDAKGMIKRIGYGVAALIYLGLTLYAIQIISGSGSTGGTSQTWVAQIMEYPFGRWLIGLAGLITIGVGLYRIYKAYTVDFAKELKLSEMNATERKWTIRFGRAGLTAQGIVFIMIGAFLVQAAVQYDPGEVRGLGGALQTLAEQPYGPWLLGLMAIGLIAHGLYMFILMRYRHIQTV
jgi:hypothetical protein